jgi:uncharacterized protein
MRLTRCFLSWCLLLLVLNPLTWAGKTADKKEKSTAAASDNLFLWEIASKDNRCYLLGSLHAAPDELYPLPKEIEDAFGKSKVFIIEANPENVDAKQIGAILAAKGTYADKKSLTEHLSKETAAQLRAYCERRKLPLDKLNSLKPWVVFTQISLIEIQTVGFDLEKGLDKYFVKKAKKSGKPIVELETLQSQLELFAGFDANLQEMLLLDTLREGKALKARVNSLIAAWKDGDLQKMNKIFLTDPLKREPKLKDLYVKIYDERNSKMVARMEKYLNGKEPAFILVGTGHIPGDHGILKLLQDKGFACKQLKREKK